MAIDLSQFDTKDSAEQGEKCFLRNPISFEPLLDEQENQLWILLAGQDSARYQKAVRKSTNKRLGRRTMARVTADELESDRQELLVEVTLDWSPGISIGSEEIDYSPDNARRLYRLRWVREQVDAFIEERSNFFKSSKNGSVNLHESSSVT